MLYILTDLRIPSYGLKYLSAIFEKYNRFDVLITTGFRLLGSHQDLEIAISKSCRNRPAV